MIRVTFEDGSHEGRPDDSPARFILLGTTSPLSELRGSPVPVYVERGGQWVTATLETWEQEARRLRLERDAAIGKANALAACVTKEDVDNAVARAVQTAEHRALAAWAESHLAASSWVRHDAGWILPSDRDMLGAWSLADAVAEQVKRDRWRLDTVEKRLADLRAWAESAEQAALDSIHMADAGATRERYRSRRSVLGEVLQRIDGKVT